MPRQAPPPAAGVGRRGSRELADDGAGIGVRPFFEYDERRADLDAVAGLAQQLAMRPDRGAGTSTTAFSVSTETSGWSATT